MKRLVVLMVIAAVFLGSCGAQGQGVGELQRESRAVDPENARSVAAELRMGAGELKATGEADALMEADFSYNVADRPSGDPNQCEFGVQVCLAGAAVAA